MLVACGGDGPTRRWRDLTLRVPDGWTVFEDEPTRFSLADADLGDEEGDRGQRRVAVQLTSGPGASPEDWRELLRQEDATVETDRAIELDGVPATQLVYRWTTNGIDTREMVVVVPSRSVTILLQPVPVAGQTDAPQLFLEARDEFDGLLDSIRFGAPVDESG